MKKLIAFSAFVFTILFSCSIVAQQEESLKTNTKAAKQKAVDYEQKAKVLFEVIPTSLDHEIQGVVESTIYNAVLVKKYYPSADFSGIIDKLNEIAVENPDPAMRVKAFLASIYLGSSNIIDLMPVHHTVEYDYIYKQITDQLGNKWFVNK
jgi:hypothetical protein